MEPQAELLTTMLDQKQRGAALPFATPEAVADGIHQTRDFALSPIREMAFRAFVKQHPLLLVWDAADDVNQVLGSGLGIEFHVFI